LIADILLSIEIGLLLVIDRHVYQMEKQFNLTELAIIEKMNEKKKQNDEVI